MPQISKRRCQAAAAIKNRWTKKTDLQIDDIYIPEISINLPVLNENSHQKKLGEG